VATLALFGTRVRLGAMRAAVFLTLQFHSLSWWNTAVEYCNDSWDGHRLRLSYLFSLGKNRQFVAGQLTVLKYHSARRRFCPVLIRRKDFKFGHFEGSQSRHSLRLGRLV
jgi:hypothetical protein